MQQGHTGFSIVCTASAYCVSTGQSSSHELTHFLVFSPSSLRFFLTWAFQPSLVSSIMPRYFAVFEWGMTLSFTVIGICWHLLLVKSTWTDLASFRLINHLLVQLFTCWLLIIFLLLFQHCLLLPYGSVVSKSCHSRFFRLWKVACV
jgi:hypothetical protein